MNRQQNVKLLTQTCSEIDSHTGVEFYTTVTLQIANLEIYLYVYCWELKIAATYFNILQYELQR